tara:strand:- start:1087 stop:2016 length:930 start_codon:yes stop_codon:yes gene_type:complete
MKIKYITISIILLFLFLNESSNAKFKNNIIVKIENEIITNFEIKNKILSTLILSNQEINQKNINNIKSKALDSLIQLKLKKIELSKHNIGDDLDRVNRYLNSISSKDINSLKLKFDKNNVEFDLFIEEIKTEFKWQKFIYEVYSKKINIDGVSLDGEVKKILKDKVDIIEYRISEIEVERKLNQSPKDIILDIQEKIDQLGFETTALNYSTATSSSNKGDLGWINSKSLSKKLFNVLSKMNINDISIPIEKQNVIMFLKLTDKRKTKAENIDVNELKKKLISQKKNELFNLYSRSHLSKLKNKSLIEYK